MLALHLADLLLGRRRRAGLGVVAVTVAVRRRVHRDGVGVVGRVASVVGGTELLRLVDELLLLGRLQVDAVVREQHNATGNPEGDGRGNERVRRVHHELALVRGPLPQVLLGGVPVGEDGDVGDEARGHPDAGNHDCHSLRRYLHWVI